MVTPTLFRPLAAVLLAAALQVRSPSGAAAREAPARQPASSPAAVNPRTAQALQLAAQESRAADDQARVAPSTGPARAAATRALARASAWNAALREASAGALPQDGDVVVTATKGEAELGRAGMTSPLRTGTLLREGDRIVTREGAAELRFHDGSLLALGAGTALRVAQAPRSFPQRSDLALESGRLYWDGSEVSPPQTRVLTPRAAARLGSGRAELSLDADGTARLAVLKGAAELSATAGGTAGPSSGWWDEVYRQKLDNK